MSSNIQYLDTTKAYDLWSEVYDTDGNFLQALDTIEIKELLPKMLKEIKINPPWKIIDLGCGTGRNTSILLTIPNIEIIGIDASPKMLEIARKRLENRPQLEVFDLIENFESPKITLQSDAIISTLVIEHIPIDIFFNHISQMLKPKGILLITNMHSEMGKFGQAGFIDIKSGNKIRPKSYIHTIEDIQKEAIKHGFEIIDIQERKVTEEMVKDLGIRSNKWIGIKVWFSGLFRLI